VLSFNAGITKNDTTLRPCFPYLQTPWRGFNGAEYSGPVVSVHDLGLAAPLATMVAYPNPFSDQVSFKFKLAQKGEITIQVMDMNGRTVRVIHEGQKTAGEYTVQMNGNDLPSGNYFATMSVNNETVYTAKITKVK
jgi:hypothetical protein